MALAQIYTALAGDTITALRWNNEFGNIYSNGTDVAFPITENVSFAGWTVALDAAGVTTIVSTASQALLLTPGVKTGTPGTNGSHVTVAAATFTDNNTAASGTAAMWNGTAWRTPTLAATNLTVTTTKASTVYIEGAPTAGTNETLTNAYALYVDSGHTQLDGNLQVEGTVTLGATGDSRTTTVATPLIVQSLTSGAPAAGIGTGILVRAESADEVPSDFGQIEFAATDIGAGTEDTYLQVLLRVAGAALIACYRFAATGAFKAIFTHANSADRTYTLPNANTTFIGTDTVDTFTNKTLAAASNQVSSVALKTATGSATATGQPTASTDVTMNDYSFFPSLTNTQIDADETSSWAGIPGVADPGNTVGRVRITNIDPGGGATTTTLRWRYMTASDDPTIWVAVSDTDGTIKATWCSDDPTPGDIPGVEVAGCTAHKLKAVELSRLSIPLEDVSKADEKIARRRLSSTHRLYRALQEHTQDQAPSRWLLEWTKYDRATGELVKKTQAEHDQDGLDKGV